MTNQATVGELAFPVLCLSRDRSIAVAESPERLERCNALAFFRNRYFEDLMVVDSTGRCFRVARAEPVPPLTGLNRTLARALNRRLRVSLALGPAERRSLDEVKALVREWMDRAPDLWEASRDLDEWRAAVAGAATLPALIRLFG